jgi:pSer/pThr/pTyr-binding forkhead associated (FHA) protein
MQEIQRRAIVAVKWGPLDGRKKVLAPGEVLRVGRGELADLVVPHDTKMSAVHFEVAWNGERCWVRDLKSAKGTRIDGEEGRAEGEIENGGWVQAGETVFTLHFEGATPARVSEEDDDDGGEPTPGEPRTDVRAERASRAEKALAALQAEAERAPLHAVLDAARDRRILELLRESVEEHRSLYEGFQGEVLAHVAPYLVKLPAGSRLLAALVREGWDKCWGIYLTSRQPFSEVRRHLRRFLMVEDEETGARMYFRFYDPATLRIFVPTCTAGQTSVFFGEIERFLVEESNGDVLQLSRGTASE